MTIICAKALLLFLAATSLLATLFLAALLARPEGSKLVSHKHASPPRLDAHSGGQRTHCQLCLLSLLTLSLVVALDNLVVLLVLVR